MSIISVTERQLFKRCRRRWDYSSFSRQSLSPITNAPALDLGTLVHAVLAEWTQHPTLNPTEIYDDFMAKQLLQTIDTYTARIGCKPSKLELQPLLDAFALGISMIKNYADYWHTPLPPGFTLVENEQTITTPIPNTEHCECYLDCSMGPDEFQPTARIIKQDESECDNCEECFSNITLDKAYSNSLKGIESTCSSCKYCDCCAGDHLEATFDGVMADEHGQLFIIERKTYSRRPSVEELDRKDQFLAYMWALQQSLPSATVVGVAYDGLWKKDVPPRGKQLSDLFLRRILLRNQHELEEFGKELALEALDMCDPNVRLYKNELVLGGCWDCNFRPLCDAQSRNVNLSEVKRMYTKVDRKEWRHTRDVEEISV